jgi:3-deoxy-D-manno-octulosonate 8-phosphate phosphatase (KDO 8-P phosphatase)
MDVDGTMTGGSVTLLSHTTAAHSKSRRLMHTMGRVLPWPTQAGLRAGCITGRESPALLRRTHRMNMEFIYMKQPVKMTAYEEILRRAGVTDSAVARIDDDLPDIPIMRRAGLAFAVGDAYLK